MCGIAGIFHFQYPDKPVSENKIANMLRVIRHRGPDESGIYLGENIGLGNVRLSIIDLSSGSQPIGVQDNRYWIVYNGELFNYPELKHELEILGYQFTTSSDTEVVAQAYACWGADCLKKFNGQFAISIWDRKEKQLFLARDRAGIRPVFYTVQNGGLYFCSEIKGIFENLEIQRILSKDGLNQVFRYWTTLSPNTPWDGIKELPPGHFMIVNQNGLHIEKYWQLEFPAKEALTNEKPISEYIEELSGLFSDAVKIRLRADVEVAAYLSGGIDSTITTSFIHEIDPNILNTFSIGFTDRDFDESVYQQEAAHYFGTNHTAFTCTSGEIGENFMDTVYFSEFPILRTAPTPMYLLSKKVRERGIKVVITGEGADEVFAGYNIFKEAKIRRFWAGQPKSEARALLLKKLYPYLPMMKDARSNTLKMFFGYALEDVKNPFYSHLLRWHNTSRISNYLQNDWQVGNDSESWDRHLLNTIHPDFGDFGDLAKSQYLEFSIFMSNYLLSSQGDRMAMGNSVEGRYPFLDYRIIEFAAKLPERYKLNALNEKYILKKMMAGKIPDSILKRSKQAYRAPIGSSLYGNNPPEYAQTLLSEKSITSFGYFNPEMVNKLKEKLLTGKMISEIDHMALAGILSTQLLHHLFIDRKNIDFKKDDIRNLKVIHEHNLKS
ncbi:MAG TPA: asparagine synthase (glutamine-hydrolyzing) [Bacteroidales bacterium]|nr:asparagine synthase (glutamine-hydrolyzing) [Bacteroidales bacterium]HRX96854.1 asparagine synthase (glutamine-hydrolyzing) [Bacteroidales bacterium]